MFSSRVPSDFEPNRLAQAAAARRAAGLSTIDLTLSNPTRAGFDYEPDLLAPLADAQALTYDPAPFGLPSARAAVAVEYARRGLDVTPDRIALTASTSEAYSLLFKLLCAPGEAVLAPAPSYPLFEHLARADAVRALPYHLDPEADWRLDLDELSHQDEDVRAVIVVHPNNPTGSFVHPDDGAALVELCARRGWALIADEVFLDYPLAGGPGSGCTFAAQASCLTFTLGGLSKSVGLPQLKLGWIVASGPFGETHAALERLAFLADTYLSVATPVQLALPRLLHDGAGVRAAILARCRSNLAALLDLASRVPWLSVHAPGGGWSVVLRFPAVVDEETLAIELLERDSVVVHPGYFFDFPRPGVLVVSLLPACETFAAGVAALLARLATHVGAP